MPVVATVQHSQVPITTFNRLAFIIHRDIPLQSFSLDCLTQVIDKQLKLLGTRIARCGNLK
ncbi:hypothetical protein D9M71_736530 [compost metagenome]